MDDRLNFVISPFDAIRHLLPRRASASFKVKGRNGSSRGHNSLCLEMSRALRKNKPGLLLASTKDHMGVYVLIRRECDE